MHNELIILEAFILTQFKDEITDLVMTYAEMAIYLKPDAQLSAIVETISTFKPEINTLRKVEHTIWKIPVCYDPVLGWDLEIVARHNNIPQDKISTLHKALPYRVFFTGFLPGFLYLGGLPDQLATPRKETPRLQIPKGAVAIAGSQTGIYPTESPGGWQIIGQTPINLFNKKQSPPSLFCPGDFIQFEEISKKQFDTITSEVTDGVYQFKKTLKK